MVEGLRIDGLQPLRKAKGKLIDVIRLAPEIFELTVTQRSGGKDWYYVALA